MKDNPFKPQDVKLYNYDSNNIEQNKLSEISKRMNNLNGRNMEYRRGYQPKSYSDVLKKPDHYSDHLKQKDSYSDHFVRPKGYSDAFKKN